MIFVSLFVINVLKVTCVVKCHFYVFEDVMVCKMIAWMHPQKWWLDLILRIGIAPILAKISYQTSKKANIADPIRHLGPNCHIAGDDRLRAMGESIKLISL